MNKPHIKEDRKKAADFVFEFLGMIQRRYDLTSQEMVDILKPNLGIFEILEKDSVEIFCPKCENYQASSIPGCCTCGWDLVYNMEYDPELEKPRHYINQTKEAQEAKSKTTQSLAAAIVQKELGAGDIKKTT